MFGGKEKKKSEEEKNAEMNKIEREIEEHAQKMAAIFGNSIERANIPDISVDFTLNQTSFTLVNNMQDYKGVTLQTQELKVGVNQYDGTNKYNKFSMDVNISLLSYGISGNFMDKTKGIVEYSPFM